MEHQNALISSPGIIFSQPWWLDAVAPNSWDEVQVTQNGELVARMPYVTRQAKRQTLLTMPPLTQTLGPWLKPSSGKYSTKLSHENKLMTQLIDELPNFAMFAQSFHYSLTNWLPFYWAGYDQTTFYTYIIEDLVNLETVWDEFQKNARNDIRKASKQLEVRTDLSLQQFLTLSELTFKRQGRLLPYSPELVERIDDACSQREQRKIFFAEDAQGRLHAAVYIIWDDRTAYYLMGGADPELRNSGATSLLLWEAIQFASSRVEVFNFEGSMIPSIERFFRAFGAQQRPYSHISKINSKSLKMRRDIRSWWDMSRDR